MTTASQIVSRAAELIGYKDPDEVLSGADGQNFLAVLNSMVDGWNTKRLYIVATQTVTANVSASPVAVGSGQTLNTARPIRVEGAWVRANGVDSPLTPMTSDEYDSLPLKDTTSTQPSKFYYEPSVPYGAIYLYPAPSGSVALYVRVLTQLSAFADLSTDYTLAPGYQKALEYSLAEELAPGRRPLDGAIVRAAMNARRAIKVTNYEPLMLEGSDVARAVIYNILTDQ